MKIVGTIGYARNTNNAKRNVVKYSNLKTKQSDSTNTYRNNVGEEQESSHQGTGALSPAMNIVPKYYRYVIVYLFTTVTKIQSTLFLRYMFHCLGMKISVYTSCRYVIILAKVILFTQTRNSYKVKEKIVFYVFFMKITS